MINRIKLGDNESYEVFVKNNDRLFWDLIIDSIENLAKDDTIDNITAFIVYGGKLKRDKEVILQRSSVNEVIDTALSKMELYEEYEICDKLIKLRTKFN